MKHWKLATMVAAGLLAIGAMTPARAQSNMSVGYVDMEKVFNNADSRKAGEDKVNSLAQKLVSREQSLQEAKLLAPTTWQQYKGLLEKDQLTSADTTTMAGIKDQLTKLDAELKALQQPAGGQLTDQQKARLNELNGYGTTNLGNLQGIDNDYQQQIQKLQTDLRNTIVADIQKASAQVAKNRNVAVVLNKQVAMGDEAAQLLVIAGGVDLTDDVVKQVNANRK